MDRETGAAIGFWPYQAAGRYYGVPVSNFVGWIFTGFITVVGIDIAFE